MQGPSQSPATEEDTGARKQFFKTQMCRFNMSNTCARGASCTFAHDYRELKRTPNLRKISLCPDWQQGKCPLMAGQCRFAHGKRELRSNKMRNGIGSKQTSRQTSWNEGSSFEPTSMDVHSREGDLAQRKANFETEQGGHAGVLLKEVPQTYAAKDQLENSASEPPPPMSPAQLMYPNEPSRAPPLPRWCLPMEQKKHQPLKEDHRSEALSGSGSESSTEICSTRVGSSSNGSEPQGKQQWQQLRQQTRGSFTSKADCSNPSLDCLTEQEAREQIEQNLETLRMYKPTKTFRQDQQKAKFLQLGLQMQQICGDARASTAAPLNCNTVAKVRLDPDGAVACFEPLGTPLRV